jgi:hypothetical protein
VQTIAMPYTPPIKTYPISFASGTANAEIELTGGAENLNLDNIVTIPPAPASTGIMVSGSDDAVKIITSSATGAFTGKFTIPGTKITMPFSGVYLQPDNVGYGFFSGTSQTGSITIAPAAP